MKDIKAHTGRLWKKYITKALIVGMYVAIFVGLYDTHRPEDGLIAMFLVPTAPGIALWAITGNVTWFGWGCLAYLLISLGVDINGWMKFLITAASLMAAATATAMRKSGWTWRRATWTALQRTSTWLQTGPETKPSPTTWEAGDIERDNTGVENILVVISWTGTIILAAAAAAFIQSAT